MTKTIWKYPVKPGIFEHEIPKGAHFLSAHDKPGEGPRLWALVDPVAPKRTYRFATVGTGHEFDAKSFKTYLGTFFPEAGLVFHVFLLHEVTAAS